MDYGNLKNQQIANMAVYWRFWAVFGRFLMVYHYLDYFYHDNFILDQKSLCDNPLISKIPGLVRNIN